TLSLHDALPIFYSNRLCRFLNNNGYAYTRLNPLEAKKQLDSLRNRKTDVNDSWRLAETQFQLKRALSYVADPVHAELLILSRFYDQVGCDLVKAKNRVHRSIQNTFPEIEQIEAKHSTTFYWELVKLFPHPSLIKSLTTEEIFAKMKLVSTHHSKRWLMNKAEELQGLAEKSYSAVDVSSAEIEQVRYLADQAIGFIQHKNKLIKQMIVLAKNFPDFKIINSIPGIGEKSTVLLMGELGDLHRFKSA